MVTFHLHIFFLFSVIFEYFLKYVPRKRIMLALGTAMTDSGDSESPKKKRKPAKEVTSKKTSPKIAKLKIVTENKQPENENADLNSEKSNDSNSLDIEAGLFDFEDDVDFNEMERILGEMDQLRSVSSPIDLLQQPPGSSTKMKLSGPKRGRPSTKSSTSGLKDSTPENMQIVGLISEEELQSALQEMQSSDDFNLDDFLDDDAQLELDLPDDLDFSEDDDFLGNVREGEVN